MTPTAGKALRWSTNRPGIVIPVKSLVLTVSLVHKPVISNAGLQHFSFPLGSSKFQATKSLVERADKAPRPRWVSRRLRCHRGSLTRYRGLGLFLCSNAVDMASCIYTDPLPRNRLQSGSLVFTRGHFTFVSTHPPYLIIHSIRSCSHHDEAFHCPHVDCCGVCDSCHDSSLRRCLGRDSPIGPRSH